jgi:hypothetical protein
VLTIPFTKYWQVEILFIGGLTAGSGDKIEQTIVSKTGGTFLGAFIDWKLDL